MLRNPVPNVRPYYTGALTAVGGRDTLTVILPFALEDIIFSYAGSTSSNGCTESTEGLSFPDTTVSRAIQISEEFPDLLPGISECNGDLRFSWGQPRRS